MRFLSAFVLIVIIAVLAVIFLIVYIALNPDFASGLGQCTSGWDCKDYYHKALRASDCLWSSAVFCENGCRDGECLEAAPEICTVGWKCSSADVKAYHSEDCTWSDATYCSNGCEAGECLQETAPDGDSEDENGEEDSNGGGGEDGGADEDFWANAKPEDFIRDDLTIKLISEDTGPCERDSALAETPGACSDSYVYYLTENCDVYEYIYGFDDEPCAKQTFNIDNIDESTFETFEGNVYLMEIGDQRLIKMVHTYPSGTEFGYIWQRNRLIFTIEGSNDAAIAEHVTWVVSRYVEGGLTLELIEVLK